MEKRRVFIYQFFKALGLTCVILSIYFFTSKAIDCHIDGIEEDDFSWVVQIDKVKVEKGKVVIEGFAFELENDAKSDAFDVILRNINTGEYAFLKMKYQERKDVNDYFSCSYDYTDSGFVAYISERKVDLFNEEYELLIRPKRKQPFRFNTFLVEGKLKYIDPEEKLTPDVTGTDLVPVVNEGYAKVLRPDIGMYVYQHNNCLYWIIEPKYNNIDSNGHIQYKLCTTQAGRLVDINSEKSSNWDNREFWLTDNESLMINTGQYLVIKKELPDSYSVTKILTGKQTKEWIWLEYFRPYYQFSSGAIR